ncbi:MULTISPECIES: S41 family peptidase [Polaribacter]|uniref:Peptidase S41 n=1 Tax=Polaribacter sejongensis TaxID=985043 RepID=A0ABM6Q235_9FLAO|nr:MULTISPECIES: S41 family peptidase [Polaribacter]AUC23248.1 peptidase S41 [Polaribacter sejongensis]
MTFKLFPKVIVFFIISLLFINCDKSEDGIPTDLEVENFIWGGLNAYYLWQSDVPDLADLRFSNQNQLNSYLEGSSSPENLFDNLLYTEENGYGLNEKGYDRFSWIVDDYVALENSFEGINLSTGMEFGINLFSVNATNVYGYVRYVIPTSDADIKGVTRGMIFTTVNGTQLTENNFQSLLFSNNTNLEIGLADFKDGIPIANGTTISLTKELVTENPVAISKVINDSGKKIGYLLYNQFSSSFDGELNAAFNYFETQLVDDLIIDLRYNGGGSVRTATYLGSMISTQPTDNVFSKQVWNEKAMKVFNPDNLIDYFPNEIKNTDENGAVILQESINSLNLATVYFIVSGSTASASELVINALRPYINVVLVGTTTRGKQVGSITLYDSEDYSRTGANLNVNHTYAMQPIVLKISNKDNQDEINGFTPEVTLPGVELAEDYGNLGDLGDPSEPLLAITIEYITAPEAKGVFKTNVQESPEIYNSKLATPASNNMYVDLK